MSPSCRAGRFRIRADRPQWSEEADPEYRHASIDIFVDPAHQGLGLGTEAVRLTTRYLFVEHGHHRITIDPAAHNDAAIRAYSKAGFRQDGAAVGQGRGTRLGGAPRAQPQSDKCPPAEGDCHTPFVALGLWH